MPTSVLDAHPGDRRSRRLDRRGAGPDWTAVLLLALVGGVIPVVLAAHFGALGIPRNDDWSYLLSAFRFADAGTLDGNGWAATGLVGQLVAALPLAWVLGRDVTALQLEVVVLGVIGLLAVFDLARQMLPERRALVVALTVASGPIWASLTVTYMTDVPAFSLSMCCLALGARAISGSLRPGLLLGALAAGFAAATVREYSIVFPIAVCAVALTSPDGALRHRRRTVGLALLGLLALTGLFFLWRRGLPGFGELSLEAPDLTSLKRTVYKSAQSGVLIGLLVAPAVALAGPAHLVRRAWARAPRASAATVVGAVVAFAAAIAWRKGSASSVQDAVSSFLGPGNYLVKDGTLGAATVSGTRPDLLAKPVLTLLTIVGFAALVLLVLAAVPAVADAIGRARDRRSRAEGDRRLAVTALAAVVYGVPCALSVLLGLAYLDRYLLPLVPLVAILVVHAGRPPAATRPADHVLTGVALAGLAILGLVFAANSASFDGTKWDVAERAAAAVGGPDEVEGGFEWTNYHAGRAIFFPDDRTPAREFCATVRAQPSAPPQGDDDVLAAEPVWGPRGTQVWMVAVRDPSC